MNIMKLMKQASEMQHKMADMQAALAAQTVEFTSGGGMVTATARGDGAFERITINPKVVDPGDVEMLEDLVRAAVDGVLKKARELSAEQMKSVTAGMNLPAGFPSPF